MEPTILARGDPARLRFLVGIPFVSVAGSAMKCPSCDGAGAAFRETYDVVHKTEIDIHEPCGRCGGCGEIEVRCLLPVDSDELEIARQLRVLADGLEAGRLSLETHSLDYERSRGRPAVVLNVTATGDSLMDFQATLL